MNGSIVDVFGLPTGPITPSQSLRRWDHGLLAGAVGWAVGAGAVAWALWRPLPGLAEVPDGGFFAQFMAYPQLLVNTLTLGHVFRHAWFDNPAAGQVSEAALHLRLLPAWVSGALCATWAGVRGLVPHPMTRHVSGPRFLQGKDAEREAVRFAGVQRGSKDRPGFMRLHPSLDLPKRVWTRHVFIAGGVGSGKTQLIYPIVRQIVRKRRKLFLLDVKGDYTSALRKALILSPWDARSAYWDIARDVRTSAQAATFASSMIPSEQGANSFFATAAELILTGCVRALQRKAGIRWGWEDLDFLLTLSVAELAPLLAENYAKAYPVVAGGEVTATNVLATLAAFTRTISQLAEAFGQGKEPDGTPRRRLSLVEWARDDYQGRPTIIAQAGPDPSLTQRYLAAALNILVPEIISGAMPDDVTEEGRSIFFVLDELAAIGKINLGPLVDKGRSKGVSVLVGVQDLAQLAAIYGEHFATALPGMLGTHLICQTQLGPTRDRLAKMLGERRVALSSIQPGEQGVTVREEMQPLIQATELTSLLGHHTTTRHPHGFGIRALAVMGQDLLLLDWPGRPVPRRRRPFVPAAWTLPTSGTPQAARQNFTFDASKEESESRGGPQLGPLKPAALVADVAHQVRVDLSAGVGVIA